MQAFTVTYPLHPAPVDSRISTADFPLCAATPQVSDPTRRMA
jgi:hypothetical protein